MELGKCYRGKILNSNDWEVYLQLSLCNLVSHETSIGSVMSFTFGMSNQLLWENNNSVRLPYTFRSAIFFEFRFG